MTKFIEVKYKERRTLVNIDNIAYVEPPQNNVIATSIKLNCKTTPTGGQVILCEDDYHKFLARLESLVVVDKAE
jgi:hypothetical protein